MFVVLILTFTVSSWSSSEPLSTQTTLTVVEWPQHQHQHQRHRRTLHRFVYATRGRHLFKVDLHACASRYPTCGECSGSRNPFCGWCVYEARCSLRAECGSSSSSSSSSSSWTKTWLASNSSKSASQCPRVSRVSPSRYVNEQAPQPLRVQLNMPLVANLTYTCHLSNNKNVRTVALLDNKNSIECDMRSLLLARQLDNNNKVGALSLEIRAAVANNSSSSSSSNNESSVRALLLVSTRLVAFNCSRMRECGACLAARLAGSCVWCASESRCVLARTQQQQSTCSGGEYSNTCVGFSLTGQSPPPNTEKRSKLSMAYSADTDIQVRLLNYATMPMPPSLDNQQQQQQPQTSSLIKCVFTTSPSWQQQTTTSDEVVATSELDVDGSCHFAAYKSARLDATLALQRVYMSLWSVTRSDDDDDDESRSTQLALVSSLNNNNTPNASPSSSSSNGEDEDDMIELDDENDAAASTTSSSNFVELSVINCRVQASSCGACLSGELAALGCGWCPHSSECTLHKDCPSLPSSSSSGDDEWTNDAYCPWPRVLRMEPRCGPRLGGAGTRLLLDGHNLGRSLDDIHVRLVVVASSSSSSPNDNATHHFRDSDSESDAYTCEAIASEYVRSSHIACRIRARNSNSGNDVAADAAELSVRVLTNTRGRSTDRSASQMMMQQMYSATSVAAFRLVVPQLVAVEPAKGLKSGGTLLRLTGRHLTCGSRVRIVLGGHLECSIVNVSAASSQRHLDVVLCRTAAYSPPSSHTTDNAAAAVAAVNVQVIMDDYASPIDKHTIKFEYVNDPRVTGVEPDRVVTIASGGLVVRLNGSHFDAVQSAHLVLEEQQQHEQEDVTGKSTAAKNKWKSSCVIESASSMRCTMPRVNATARLATAAGDMVASLQLNEAPALPKTLSGVFSSLVRVYADPVLDSAQLFTDKTSMMLIRGEHLLRGLVDTDYRVWIALANAATPAGPALACNVTSISMNMIACVLPDVAALARLHSSAAAATHDNNKNLPPASSIFSSRYIKSLTAKKKLLSLKHPSIVKIINSFPNSNSYIRKWREAVANEIF